MLHIPNCAIIRSVTQIRLSEGIVLSCHCWCWCYLSSIHVRQLSMIDESVVPSVLYAILITFSYITPTINKRPDVPGFSVLLGLIYCCSFHTSYSKKYDISYELCTRFVLYVHTCRFWYIRDNYFHETVSLMWLPWFRGRNLKKVFLISLNQSLYIIYIHRLFVDNTYIYLFLPRCLTTFTLSSW